MSGFYPHNAGVSIYGHWDKSDIRLQIQLPSSGYFCKAPSWTWQKNIMSRDSVAIKATFRGFITWLCSCISISKLPFLSKNHDCSIKNRRLFQACSVQMNGGSSLYGWWWVLWYVYMYTILCGCKLYFILFWF